MIFATVGTSKLQFNRLLILLDELCDENIINGKSLFVQIGYSTYIPRNYKYICFVDNEKHHQLLKEAEYVITHSGTGSVITSIKEGKKVIVFPRLQEYGEHADNHQLELADFFSYGGYVKCAKNKNELIQCIGEMDCFSPKKFESNNDQINNIIINYIDSIQESMINRN